MHWEATLLEPNPHLRGMPVFQDLPTLGKDWPLPWESSLGPKIRSYKRGEVRWRK